MSIRQSQGRHRAVEAGSAPTSHRRPTSRRRRVTAAAVGGVVLLGGGAAMAAWSISGEGPGDAQAIAPDRLQVDDQAAAVADLYPGTTGDVVVRVRNPNPYPVVLQTARFGTVTAGGDCPQDSVSAVAASMPIPGSVTLSDGNWHELTLADAVAMTFAAPDECKGATFSVRVTVEGLQVA
ncbi:hypothetical protein ACI8AV_21270 [Geodermatophilus sp. SYSU D00804]